MLKSPFFNAVFEALEDEINRIKFEKISRKYVAKKKEIAAITKILESLPETIETETGPVNVRELITDLGDLYEHMFGIGFDIAIKRGFSLAFQFYLYNLAMELDERLPGNETGAAL